MELQPPSNLPFEVAGFASMQFSLGGANPVAGGTALVMASIAPMIKHGRSGPLKRRRSARSQHFNSNAMKLLVNGS
jgi:hypothetical protein